ncbi:MAG: hypothetical protein Q4C55_09225 [Eubacterium sp.]|nr:hypothetical protein [Eubacterium sp.]
MNRLKNAAIVILAAAFVAIVAFGLKTWNNEGVAMSSQEEKTAVVYQSAPEIKITSDNLFTPEGVTNTAVTLSFSGSKLKDTYLNGKSLEKAEEAMVDKDGAYEAIAETEEGQKVILKFTIDSKAEIDAASAVKGSTLKSEAYTGEIKAPEVGPVVQAVSPADLKNGGTVSAESVEIAYSSADGIASVTLDGEAMDITGSVISYMSGAHSLMVTDTKGQSTVFTFTNTYGEE